MNETIENLSQYIHSKWCLSELEDFRFRFLNNLLDTNLKIVKSLERACYYLDNKRNTVFYDIDKFKVKDRIINSLIDSSNIFDYLVNTKTITIKRYVKRNIMPSEVNKIDIQEDNENILTSYINLSYQSKLIINEIAKICYEIFIVKESEFVKILAQEDKIKISKYIEKNIIFSKKYKKIDEYLNKDYIKLYNWFKNYYIDNYYENNKIVFK